VLQWPVAQKNGVREMKGDTEEGTDEHNNKEDSIRIRRSIFNKIALGAVAALAVATFFGGYLLGGLNARLVGSGGGGSTTIAESQQGGGGLEAVVPTAPSQQAPSPSPPQKIQSVSLDGAITLGKQDAPVTMVEFGDFQCPFCKRHFDDSFNQIKQEYVNPGQVKYVYMNFPLDKHPNAKPAANAAECANEQGKFWEYHDALFSNQTEWENQDATNATATFKQYAAGMGLNADQFNSCLDSNKFQNEIDKEIQQGSSYGVSGTPTFYIGNEKAGYTAVEGAKPYASLKQTIDRLLQQG
jgi:protein-disulfide isomerase